MTIYRKVDLSEYIVISLWWGCNNNCSICMLSGIDRALPVIGLDSYKKALIDIIDEGRFKNLILSGAEVTTFHDLDRYIQFAKSLGWFKKIQIQTNGRMLQDKEYLNHLIDWGVNEFFVSIHGTEDVHDTITRTRGSFRETMKGLKNLEDFDVNVISNTVLTKPNSRDIPELMKLLASQKISEINLWNFFPMEKTDSRDFVVSMNDFVQLLPGIQETIRPSGKALVLKSFPECLSIGSPGFFDNGFPVTILPDPFWREFSECGFGRCIYRDRCRSDTCWGLSSAYIHKYGDERDLLSPRMKTNLQQDKA